MIVKITQCFKRSQRLFFVIRPSPKTPPTYSEPRYFAWTSNEFGTNLLHTTALPVTLLLTLLLPGSKPHRANESPSCGFDPAARLCVSGSRLYRWEVCDRSLVLRLSPQGFHDQPGVEPQRLLSAQRRHHRLQPVAVQLPDLQVEGGGRGLQPLSSPLPPPPPCHTLPHTPLTPKPFLLPIRVDAQLLSHSKSIELKHARTNGRERIKNLRQKGGRRRKRLYTILKGWFFCTKMIYFLCLVTLLGSSLNQNISRMFVCGGKVKGRETSCGAFVAREAKISNIFILDGMEPDENSGGAVTLLHLHLHTHKCRHAHGRLTTCKNVHCHITRGVSSFWWIVYRSGVGGERVLKGTWVKTQTQWFFFEWVELSE